MQVSVKMRDKDRVMLIKQLETGGVVVLRAGVKILTDWGLSLPSSPPIIA